MWSGEIINWLKNQPLEINWLDKQMGQLHKKKIIYYKCPISNPGDHHYYLIKKGERTSLITFSLGLWKDSLIKREVQV